MEKNVQNNVLNTANEILEKIKERVPYKMFKNM